MSTNSRPAICGSSRDISCDDDTGASPWLHSLPAFHQGDGSDIQPFPSAESKLPDTPVLKEPSKSSQQVIVERTPNLVRKLTVLKQLPERQPAPKQRERKVIIKSTKLPSVSYPGFCDVADVPKPASGSKKLTRKLDMKTDKRQPAPKQKERNVVTKSTEMSPISYSGFRQVADLPKPATGSKLKTDKENMLEEMKESPEMKDSERTENDVSLLPREEDTITNAYAGYSLSPRPSQNVRAQDYVKLQIKRRRQQRIQDRNKKQEDEEMRKKKLKELKETQLKIVQNNVKRARQKRQLQKQEEEQQQEEQQQQEEEKQQDDVEYQEQEIAWVTFDERTLQFLQDTDQHVLQDHQQDNITAAVTDAGTKEEEDINVTLLNMVENLQKNFREIREFNKKNKEEELRSRQSRKKDTTVHTEVPTSNFGTFVGNLNEVKRTRHGKRSLVVSDCADSSDAEIDGLDLKAPLKRPEIQATTPSSSQPYNVERQVSPPATIDVTTFFNNYLEKVRLQELAVTKIQAAFRGYQVRKILKMRRKMDMKLRDSVNQKSVNDYQTRANRTTLTQYEIGSRRATRQEKYKSLHYQGLDVLVRKLVSESLKKFMETGKKKELAATKIQTAFRGYQARKLHNVKRRKMTSEDFTPRAVDEIYRNKYATYVKKDARSHRSDGFVKAANFPVFSSSLTAKDPLSDWLKPVYVEPCSYNMITAVQNTMVSRSGPRQPYWVQANREHARKESGSGKTKVNSNTTQTSPVIDASKGKMRKHLTVQQFIHASKMNRKEYESYLVSDDNSTHVEDGLSANSSIIEADHNSSSDDSRVRWWRKRLNYKSPDEVLPSRIHPVYWSNYDSEVIMKPSHAVRSRSKSHLKSGKEAFDRNIKSLSSVSRGKPAVMPKKMKTRHHGLVVPNVELRRRTERSSKIQVNSRHTDNSDTDTWDSHTVRRQHTDKSPISAYDTVYRKGQTSQDTSTLRRSDDKSQVESVSKNGQGNFEREEMYKQKENKMGSVVRDANRERINVQKDKPTRVSTSGTGRIADIVETGRMLHPSALHLQFQAEMNRLDSVEESRQRLTEIEAIFAHNLKAKQELEGRKQTERQVEEDRQHQAEPNQTKSSVQTQTLDRDDQFKTRQPTAQTQRNNEAETEVAALKPSLGQDKQIQVDSSAESNFHTQTLVRSRPSQVISSFQPFVLMQETSNSPSLSSVPRLLLDSHNQTHEENDNSQDPAPVHRHALFEQIHTTRIDNLVTPILLQSLENVESTSEIIVETLQPHLAVEQVLQQAKHTRRMINLDYKGSSEASERRRDFVLGELRGKFEEWDSKHREFMNMIEKEDTDLLNRILLRNICFTRPSVDLSASQFSSAFQGNVTDNLVVNTRCAINPGLMSSAVQLNNANQVGENCNVGQQDNNPGSAPGTSELQELQDKQIFANVTCKRGSDIPADALLTIGKEVMDLEKTVVDNLEDTTPDQSFQTISEAISEEDVSSGRTRSEKVQDGNLTQTSNFSDVSMKDSDHNEKLVKIKKSLHKIDQLIHEERATAQEHVHLLNEKFKLLKDRTRADIKLLLVQIREKKEKGQEQSVLELKKKHLSLLHNLEQVREENRREYDKLIKATVKRKQALKQQKALIKSYLKSVELKERKLVEGHRLTSPLKDEEVHHKSLLSSVNITEDISVPSVEEELEPVHKSKSLELSEIVPTDLVTEEEEQRTEVNVTDADSSSKNQLNSEKSEEKFSSFEEITDSSPQTEAGIELSDLESRVRGLCEQLHEKKREAEKLWREQQKKKKQRLRIKEDTLLKQIKAYDAYISKTKKELQDQKDCSTDTSFPLGQLWATDQDHSLIEHDSDPAAGDFSAPKSRRQLFMQPHVEDKEKNSETGDSRLVSTSSGSQPIYTKHVSDESMLREHDNSDVKTNELHFSSDNINTNIQLTEDSQLPINKDHGIVNSSVESAIQSLVSYSTKDFDFMDDEEISEDLEHHSEIVSVIQDEIEEERKSELYSVIHNQNSGSTIQELLTEKPKSESVIQELLGTKHQLSIQEFEGSIEEVESIPEEVTHPTTEIEDSGEVRSGCPEQNLENIEEQSSSVHTHSKDKFVTSSVVSLPNESVHYSIREGLHSVENDTVKEEISNIEQEMSEVEEQIPQLEDEIIKSEEKIQESEEESSKLKEEISKSEQEFLSSKDEIPETDEEFSITEDVIETEEEISKTEDEISRTEEKIPKAEERIPRTEEEIPGMEEEIPGTEEEIPGTEDEIPGTEEEIPGTEEEIPRTEDEIPGTEEEILRTEEEILRTEEEIPRTEDEIPGTEEEIPGTEEFPDSQEISEVDRSEHIIGTGKVNEKTGKGLSSKVERITNAIFEKLLNDTFNSFQMKSTKYHDTAKVINKSEFEIESSVQESYKQRDLINEEINENEASNFTNSSILLSKEDVNVDRVDNITKAILEQLLAESSVIYNSKKSKVDSSKEASDVLESTQNESTPSEDVAPTGAAGLTLGLPERSGINVKKRVYEILAESSGSLSNTKEKTRPQDFMITTYDVLSPEDTPEHTPQPGSPSKEVLDKTVAAVSEELEAQQKMDVESSRMEPDVTNNEVFTQEWFDEDFGLSHTRREAEELRLQQLQIEQEIQELEQAQEQLPYFYIREIPNKPPPPYTPPSQIARNATAPTSGASFGPLGAHEPTQLSSEEEPRFIPSTAEDLTSITVQVTDYLHNILTTGGDIENAVAPPDFYGDINSAPMSDVKKSSRRIFKKLIFDLTKDMIRETYGLDRDKPCVPWEWPAFSHKRNKPPPRSKETLQEMVRKQALVLFGFVPKTYKEKLVIRWSRKKRDYVDEILMKESHEEESAWTNYDEDEVIVKNEIATGLLDSLLDETIQIYLDIRRTKLKKV